MMCKRHGVCVRESKKKKALLAHFIFYVVAVHAMVAHGERETPPIASNKRGEKHGKKVLL